MAENASAEALHALERRLQRVEDHLAIMQIITFVGPACDSGSADAFASVWAPDGVYRVGEREFAGRDGITEVITGGPHLRWTDLGCSHFMSPPHIMIDGDQATAVNYTTLIVHNSDVARYEGRRLSANRWRLSRRDGVWEVDDRTIELLDGRPDGQRLLAEVVQSPVNRS